MKNYSFLKKAIFNIDDIRSEFNSESALFSALKSLEKNHKIVKLKAGLYATVNPLYGDLFVNKFEIGSAIKSDAYCAYHTAMDYYGLSTQVFNAVELISKTQSPTVTIQDRYYHFFVCPYDDGVLELHRYAPFRITCLERTIVDCIDRMDLCGGIEEVLEGLDLVEWCDEKKLMLYLDGYGKKFLYKKTGFLFSLIRPYFLSDSFYEFCKSKMALRDDDVREFRSHAYVYNKEWRIYAPSPISWDMEV